LSAPYIAGYIEALAAQLGEKVEGYRVFDVFPHVHIPHSARLSFYNGTARSHMLSSQAMSRTYPMRSPLFGTYCKLMPVVLG